MAKPKRTLLAGQKSIVNSNDMQYKILMSGVYTTNNKLLIAASNNTLNVGNVG